MFLNAKTYWMYPPGCSTGSLPAAKAYFVTPPPLGGDTVGRGILDAPFPSRHKHRGISEAWHRRRPGGPSRYNATTFRACRVIPMRVTRGATSSAQATDRSLPGRPESSFPPLGPCSRRGIAIPGPKWPANRAAPFSGSLYPPPAALRRETLPTEPAALPLAALPPYGCGVPLAGTSRGFGGGPTYCKRQWGGRRCRPGFCKLRTAHRRHEPRVQGPQALVVFPPLLTPNAVRPPRRRAPGGVSGKRAHT